MPTLSRCRRASNTTLAAYTPIDRVFRVPPALAPASLIVVTKVFMRASENPCFIVVRLPVSRHETIIAFVRLGFDVIVLDKKKPALQ
jgi:hypothetical protein